MGQELGWTIQLDELISSTAFFPCAEHALWRVMLGMSYVLAKDNSPSRDWAQANHQGTKTKKGEVNTSPLYVLNY